MSWQSLYFGFRGRINRARFWQASVALFLLLLGLTIAAMLGESVMLTDNDATILIGLWAPIALTASFAWLAVGAKRLQDINVSGRWVALYVVCAVIPVLNVLLAPVIWLILGLIRGIKGPNKYGADPLTKV